MYSKNHNYFSKINNQKKAYILGFLYGDGYVHYRHRTSYIGCSVKDKDILEFIKQELDYSGPIDRLPHHPNDMYRLRICGHQLAKDLIRIGMRERIWPDLKKSYVASFVCGLFDSDGSVHVSKELHKRRFRRITFSGKRSIMIFVRRFLHEEHGFILPKIKVEICGTHVLQYVTKHVELFYKRLYRHAPYRLRRKEKIFLDNEIVQSSK